MENNLIADKYVFSGCLDASGKKTDYRRDHPTLAEEFGKRGNLLVEGDPGFVNLGADNFDLKPDSPAWKLGFQRIPFEKIGLYTDDYRKTLPARHDPSTTGGERR